DHPCSARPKGKPRSPLPRRLSQQRRCEWSRRHHPEKRTGWTSSTDDRTASGNASGTQADHCGDEVMAQSDMTASGTSKATFRIWRGNTESGGFKDYTTEISPGMVVLDAVHKIQAEQA